MSDRDRGDARVDLLAVLPDLRGRGAERATLLLLRGLRERGWSVELAVSGKDGASTAEVPRDLLLRRLPSQGMLASLPSLVWLLVRRRPRMVLSALTHANVITLIAARLARYRGPVIVIEHTVFSRIAVDATARVVRELAQWTYPRADQVVAVSRSVAVDVTRCFRLADDQVVVLPNALDLAHVRALAGVPAPMPGGQTVLGVGRLAPEKGFDLLLEAHALLARERDVSLVLVGDGPDVTRLTSIAESLGTTGTVVFAGHDSNPYRWIAKAGVVAISSLYEGLPTVALEAAVLGTPVVAVDDGYGLSAALAGIPWSRVESREPRALADGLASALDSRALPSDGWEARTPVADDEGGSGKGPMDGFDVPAVAARFERLAVAAGWDPVAGETSRGSGAGDATSGRFRGPAATARRDPSVLHARPRRPLRVAVYRPYASALDPRRYQVQELILARALALRGFEVTVFSSWADDLDLGPWESDQVRLRRIVGPNLQHHQTLDIRGLLDLAREGFDVVQVHEESQLAAGAIAHLCGSPVVLYQGAYVDSGARVAKAKSIMRSTWGRRLRTHAVPVAKTRTAADCLRRWGYPPARVIPVGYDAAYVASLVDRQAVHRLGLPQRYVLGVGAMVERKNWKLAMGWMSRALRCDAVASLVLVGDGPQGVELDAEAARMGLGAAYRRIPRLSQPESLGVISGARALVHPSSIEEYGMVLLEALGLGVPIVALPTAGSLEMLQGDLRDGVLAEPAVGGNRLERLLLDEAYREGQAKAGLTATRGRLSVGAMGDSFALLYSSLANRP